MKQPGKRVDPFYSSAPWRKMRAAIRKRDGNRCTNCGRAVGFGSKVRGIVDHIIPRRARPDLALDPANLRTLCTYCHEARHPKRGTGAAIEPPAATGPDGFPLDGSWQ